MYRFHKFKNKTSGEEFERLASVKNPLEGMTEDIECLGRAGNLYGSDDLAFHIADPSLSTKRAQHFQDTVISPKKQFFPEYK